MANLRITKILASAIMLFCLIASVANGADLLAHWKLDGNLTDSSGNGKNGIGRTNGTSWVSSAVLDGGISVNGNRDYVLFPRIDTGTTFTVMAWVKPTQQPQTWARVIESHFWSGFYLGADDYNQWMFSVNGNFNIGRKAIRLNQWQHLVGTYDGVTARFYVDGNLIGGGRQHIPTLTNDYITIGRQREESADWSALVQVDDVRIYNDALNLQDIQNIYNDSVSGPISLGTLNDVAVNPAIDPRAYFQCDITNRTSQPVTSCRWFKNTDGTETEISPQSGRHTMSLSPGSAHLLIHDVCYADQGSYYCRLELADSSLAVSNPASLSVRNGLSHRYSFNDSSMADEINADDATLVDGTGFSSFQNGQLNIISSSMAKSYGLFSDAILSSLNNWATVEVWFTSTVTVTPGTTILNFGDFNGTSGQSGLSVYLADEAGFPSIELFTNGSCSAKVTSDEQLAKNVQHMLAFSWNGTTRSVDFYVNGELSGSMKVDQDLSDLNDLYNWLGRPRSDTMPMFRGSINELRIYDWPFSSQWIAQHYAEGPDTLDVNPCLYELPADINNDCRVDILDFAEIAKNIYTAGTSDRDLISSTPKLAPAQLFDISDVRLTGGPFRKALDYNVSYLLSLEADRLLYGMRTGSGLPEKTPYHYGGWDNWGSTAAGGYLSACALAYAATGDNRLKDRCDYVVSEMAAAQLSWGDGGLNVNNIEAEWFNQLRLGNLQTSHVIPWYQVQFILSGLRDAWLYTHNQQALDSFISLGDWCIDVTNNLTASQWQAMVGCECGGPHEYLADLYAITGQQKYLDLAKKFRHNYVCDPLYLGNKSVLYGLHANTQVPKFVGYERIAELDSSAVDMALTAENFYNLTTRYLSWANGSNSQWEGFFHENDFHIKVDDNCGPETCNTFNMIKLANEFYRKDAQPTYIDYCENALYNHLLPSIDPDQGGYVYYTSMKPGHYRVFSTDTESFWCCVVTGMQNPGRYAEMAYAHTDDSLMVNMFMPSELNWQAKGLKLKQDTRFPENDTSRLIFDLASPQKFKLNLRCPEWIHDQLMQIKVNGNIIANNSLPGEYIAIDRVWNSGDIVEVRLPLHIWTRDLPTNPDYKAVYYGPVMLAGALGTLDLSPADFTGGGPNDQAAYKEGLWSDVPVLVGNDSDIASKIIKSSGDQLVFSADGLAQPHSVTIKPFYDVHRERYMVYWPTASQADYPAVRAAMNTIDQRTNQLRNAVDHIEIAVSTSSEDAHAIAGENLEIGGLPGMRWRTAYGGGWLSYNMKVTSGKDMSLVCRYWGSDGGARAFAIYADGQFIANESLNASKPNEFIYKYYTIPASITSGKNSLVIKFDAPDNNTMGGIFELWMVEK